MEELFNLCWLTLQRNIRSFMFTVIILTLGMIVFMLNGLPSEYDKIYFDQFPASFRFGIATASYQVEGGASHRGKNIWDTFSHTPGNIEDGSTGDDACDSFRNYETDVKNVAALGLDFYRFSISWSRLIPTGVISEGISEAGLDYYHKLLNKLEEEKIEAMVTLYHWDLPQKLQDYGGWTNVSLAERFQEYADLCFKSFGPKVKRWITFNEPRETSLGGYEIGYMAPGYKLHGTGTYNTSYTILRAHAAAYRLYAERYRNLQFGEVGITLNCDWAQPVDNSVANRDAADRFLQWYIGIWAHPILLGDYPSVIKETVKTKTNAKGFRKSRLPEFSQDEVDYIKGTFDFLGLNSYTTRMVQFKQCQDEEDHYNCDQDLKAFADPTWPTSGSSWLRPVPWGIRKLLSQRWIKHQYPNYREIIVTENGVSDRPESVTLCDQPRVNFFQNYLNNVLMAIRIDEVNVVGYTAWSLMDNFEWAHGYTERFGLFWTSFDRPDKLRTMKSSGLFYKKIVEARGFPNKQTLLDWLDEVDTY
ncbi:unnamed protein product [Oikopleura dioica]|uniref:Cytosolic beta-glucosidase n=2 Tax=Oikopleura dioica TaxID=34765 RepID=E4Y2A7_OIKDI|nr:unnamed protein product [Oikopleura dioica]